MLKLALEVFSHQSLETVLFPFVNLAYVAMKPFVEIVHYQTVRKMFVVVVQSINAGSRIVEQKPSDRNAGTAAYAAFTMDYHVLAIPVLLKKLQNSFHDCFVENIEAAPIVLKIKELQFKYVFIYLFVLKPREFHTRAGDSTEHIV